MFLKKLLLSSITPRCLKDRDMSLEVKPECPKKTSRRISLSDLSGSSTLSIMSDLSSNSVLGSNLHIFTLEELRDITQSFGKSNFLGKGGFGRVYKGFIDDKLRPGLEAQLVAIKVLDLDGKQGHREWLTEVIFLGQLKHPHLVNLIGYCCEDENRLLVYEYMDRGSLDSKLFNNYTATLPWLTRLKIAIGAAKGLAFLHEEERPVIYRDVKTSNILLDTDYNAKVSDFGLATDNPEGEDHSDHVSTRVVGTRGYAAPEYIMTGHPTTMSDVFSFGIVLLEMLTGRRSVEKKRPTREKNLVEWARPMLKDPRKLDRIMDTRLEGQYSREGARKAALLAHRCLISHHPKSRPTMKKVVKTLEHLMDLNDDIPVGHFVYVVPTEDAKETSDGIVNIKKSRNECNNDDLRKNITSEEHRDRDRGDNNKDKGHHHRHRNSQRRKHQIKPLNSRGVYSDTTLYETLGTRLYFTNQAPHIQ